LVSPPSCPLRAYPVTFADVIFLGVPRLLEQDYSYEGYHFPKHAVVHILDIALSQNSELYPDAETYNPKRWLDPSFPTYQGPSTEYPRMKGHHIFGRGRRMCPGQDLVELEMLVLCGNMVKYFQLDPKIGENGEKIWPDPNKWTTDVIGGPLPFECDIRVRDERRKAEVELMYREAFPQ
jgi:cytochrome P450